VNENPKEYGERELLEACERNIKSCEDTESEACISARRKILNTIGPRGTGPETYNCWMTKVTLKENKDREIKADKYVGDKPSHYGFTKKYIEENLLKNINYATMKELITAQKEMGISEILQKKIEETKEFFKKAKAKKSASKEDKPIYVEYSLEKLTEIAMETPKKYQACLGATSLLMLLNYL
jgi:hypothetical protein